MSGRRSALFAALAGLTVALPARAQWGSGGMRRGPSGPVGGDNLRRRPPDDGSTEAVGFGVGFLVDAVGQRLGECQQRLALQTQQLGAWNAFGGAVQGVVTDLLRQSAADTGAGTAIITIVTSADQQHAAFECAWRGDDDGAFGGRADARAAVAVIGRDR